MSKRSDGFHDLETVFYPVPVNDVLEIIQTDGPFQFSQSGITVDGPPETNLCVKAWNLMRDTFPNLPNIQMHLHKAIPLGAGLGGGSSDAAHVLLLINQKFKLGIARQQLLSMALSLGSDCPFFIHGEPCFARGRGEMMEPLDLDLSGYYLVIVHPGIHISTSWAFGQLTPHQPKDTLSHLITLPVDQWRHKITNDFEEVAVRAYPAISQIKALLYAAGAVFAAMSGSGSALFGIFKTEPELTAMEQIAGHWVRKVKL